MGNSGSVGDISQRAIVVRIASSVNGLHPVGLPFLVGGIIGILLLQ